MVDKLALGQVFLRVLNLSPLSTDPPMFQTHTFVSNANIISAIAASLNNALESF
jgi:hypothetical protein